MAITDIQIWLAGTMEYAAGIELLARYSDNRVLKMMLAMGETSFNREKMIEELTALNRCEDAQYKARPPAEERKILNDDEWLRAPEPVRALKKRATELFKENGRRHAKLCQLVTDAKRIHGKDIVKINEYLKEHDSGVIANTILDVDDEIALLFNQIDYWKAEGKLPEALSPVPEDVRDKAELIRARNNLRSNLSKARKKQGKEKEVNEMEQKLSDLQRRIDGLD